MKVSDMAKRGPVSRRGSKAFYEESVTMKRTFARHTWLRGAALVVAVIAGWRGSVLAATNDLPAAEASAAQAKAAEDAANTEWNSREMARSATREIARSERQKAQAALDAAAAAQEACKRLGAAAEAASKAAEAEAAPEQKAVRQQAAAQAEAEATAAKELLQQKLATLRTAAERLIADTTTANKATDELFVAEDSLRDKMCAARTAEREVLELKAQAAEQAKAPDALAARQSVNEVAALSAWEVQQWSAVQRNSGSELAEQSGEAARIAADIGALETEPQRKADLTQFAEKATAVKAAADHLIAEKNAAIDAAVAEVYLLRAAAMGGLKPLTPDRWDYAKARHLLVRAGLGGTPQEVEQLHAMGLYKAVDHLLEFHRQPYAAAPFDATPPPAADPLEGKLRCDFIKGQVAGARNGVERGQVGALRQWWLKRMVESPRPLQEKLTLFWHGHFATQDSVVQNSYTVYRQNMLFREHAAGNFGGLLYSIVHDPAMLRYLDNNRNVKGKPNENLAREILELFSMGVDQGYTEKDIVEAARALTGYTYDNATGSFRFDYAQHDTTDKTIFGCTGPWTGDDLVRLILEQPATSHFIAFKLHEFFAYHDPDPETVDHLATVLRTNGYELKPMLRNLFLSEEFYSEKAMGTQIKCPVQVVVGTLRDLGVKQLARYDGLDGAIRDMGQDLLEPPDVKGWRYGRTWISTGSLFSRYNSVADLIKAAPQPSGGGVDLVGVLETGGCNTPAEAVDYLVKACLDKPLADQARQELVATLATLPPRAEWNNRREEANQMLRQLLILILSTPEYQLT